MGYKIVAGVHQPNFIPWPGYFNKIYKSDIFILLDDVEFPNRSLINRSKIKAHGKELLLTVPVVHQSMRKPISETLIANHKSVKKNWKSIEQNYSKSDFFHEYSGDFRNIFLQEYKYVHELNIALLKLILDILNINTKVVTSSSIALNEITCKNTRIINLCKSVGATEYLSGVGARVYNDDEMYRQASIKLTYQNFKISEYKQLGQEFLNGLSILDMLFNIGALETLENIKGVDK